MTRAARLFALPGAYLAVGLAVLASALVGGGAVLIVAAGLITIASVAIVARLSLADAGIVLSIGFAFTTCWNAVAIGPVRPADLLLLAALGAFVADAMISPRSGGRVLLPWWLAQIGLVIIVVAALNEVAPFAVDYVAHRPNYNALGAAGPAPGTNLGGAARWLISIIGVPVVIGMAARHRRRAIHWIAVAFACGAAVAGFVAVTDDLGITTISTSLIPDRFGSRQASLTVQPNHLALICVLGIPIACWMLSASRRLMHRATAIVALVGDIAGVYLSGSRGGTVVAVLALILSLLILRELRARILQVGVVAAVAATAVLYLNPGLVGLASSTTRLTSSSSVLGSDAVRGLLGAQADRDVSESPLYGIGLQVIVTAHDIYKQLLAAGGVLLLVSFAIFVFGMLRAGRQAWTTMQLSLAASISVVSWLVLGAVENILIDRYVYVPVGLLVALAATTPRAGDDAASDEAPPEVRSDDPRRALVAVGHDPGPGVRS